MEKEIKISTHSIPYPYGPVRAVPTPPTCRNKKCGFFVIANTLSIWCFRAEIEKSDLAIFFSGNAEHKIECVCVCTLCAAQEGTFHVCGIHSRNKQYPQRDKNFELTTRVVMYNLLLVCTIF
jgi:hypothetical protein